MPSSDRARATINAVAPRISGAATEQPRPRRPAEAAEQEREDLAQLDAGDVHRHGQQRREDRPDGVAGEQQAGQPTGTTGPAEPEDEPGRPERADEGQPMEQPELDDRTSWIGSRTAMAAPSAAPDGGPEHVRVGQRVAEQALERRAGDGQPAADRPSRSGRAAGGAPRRSPRRPGVQVTPMSIPNAPRQDRPRRSRAGRSRTVPSPTPSTSSDDEQRRPPRGRRRARPRAGPTRRHRLDAVRGRVAPAAIDRATAPAADVDVRLDRRGEVAQAERQARAGPGDLDVAGRGGRRRCLTAVMASQPGRAATSSGVGV